MMSQDKNKLIDIKDSFIIGNYQQCIKESQLIKSTDPEIISERDVYLYRSYLALGKYAVVIEEIESNFSSSLQYLKKLALCLQSSSSRMDSVYDFESKFSSSGLKNIDTTSIIVAATIFLLEKNVDAALSVLGSSDHLECMSIKIQTFLAINRLDLARKYLKVMQERDEDATITQITQAWVFLQLGGEKVQDAYYIFQELIDKFGSTPLLLNGQACCFIQQGKFEEAEIALNEALEKDGRCPDTFINMIGLSQQFGKSPEVAKRYLTQLKETSPSHYFIESYQNKLSDFNIMVDQYKK